LELNPSGRMGRRSLRCTLSLSSLSGPARSLNKTRRRGPRVRLMALFFLRLPPSSPLVSSPPFSCRFRDLVLPALHGFHERLSVRLTCSPLLGVDPRRLLPPLYSLRCPSTLSTLVRSFTVLFPLVVFFLAYARFNTTHLTHRPTW